MSDMKCQGLVNSIVAIVVGVSLAALMRAGCADYVVAQQPVLIGRLGVRMANELIRGQTSQEKSIEVPLFAVTPANVGSIDKSTMQAPKGWTPGS
jgi:ribose transport system substrate-binding protein